MHRHLKFPSNALYAAPDATQNKELPSIIQNKERPAFNQDKYRPADAVQGKYRP